MNIYDEIDECITKLDEDYKKFLPTVLVKLLSITEKLNKPYDWLWVKLQTEELRGNYNPNTEKIFTTLCKNIGITDITKIKEKYREILRDFMKYRTFEIDKDGIYADSTANLILQINSIEQKVKDTVLPDNLAPIDLYYEKQKHDNIISTYQNALSNYKAILNHIYTHTYQILINLKYSNQQAISQDATVQKIETIFNKFHDIATQLLKRYEGRETLKLKDEYDVQDLLHSLLLLYFNDIRKEESVPSHAGSNSRLDFLIPDYQIGIEVKMTRKGLSDNKIGQQLLVDIGRYQSHQNCKTLLCFIYDPDYNIDNFKGLKDDLESHSNDDFNIKVYISR